MFLEKHSRFFRQYEFVLGAKRRTAPIIQMIDDTNRPSFHKVLVDRMRSGKAHDIQANGDRIDLIDVVYRPSSKALILLFHRTSPGAADPFYRKGESTDDFSLRQVSKDADETQAVSAHVVIQTKAISDSRYPAILEEIPSISMSSLAALSDKL